MSILSIVSNIYNLTEVEKSPLPSLSGQEGLSSSWMAKQGIHRGAQHLGQAEGQGQRGVILIVLDGVDGLPGHMAELCQLLL